MHHTNQAALLRASKQPVKASDRQLNKRWVKRQAVVR